MEVIIYTTAECPWCKKTKAFFKENNVKFKEIDVGNDENGAKEAVKKSGQMGVPVIDVNRTVIVGFKEGELRKALKL